MTSRFLFYFTSWVLTSFLAPQAFASETKFDTCVNSLYTLGGISEARARQLCVAGISPEILKCQSKKFLVDFLEPLEALTSCQQNLEVADIKDYPVYRGTYEQIPVSIEKKSCLFNHC